MADSQHFSDMYLQANVFIANIAWNEMRGAHSAKASYGMMTLYINVNHAEEVHFPLILFKKPIYLFTQVFFFLTIT